MERESYIFYRGFYEAISCLTQNEQAECLRVMSEYALNGVEVESDGVVRALFLSFKPQIDANNRKFLNGLKGADYGKRGGRPRKNPSGVNEKTPEKPQENPKETPNVNVNDNVNVNVNENVNENVNVNVNEKESKGKTQAFIPPSLDQVKDYCWERKNKVDAQAFIDFYTSKGWMIGKTKMKDWRAAVRTWERRDNEKVTPIKRDNKGEVDDFFKRELGL